jgi:hypothetical protein
MSEREKWDLIGGFAKIIGTLEKSYSDDDIRQCFEVALDGRKVRDDKGE